MRLNKNVSLSSLTTLKVGGPAKCLVNITSKKDLTDAVLFAKEEKLPILVLGGGSNVLIPDDGFDGLVLKIELEGVSFSEEDEHILASVCAGEDWDSFVKNTVSKGFWGIENLSWIPGTVGGTPIQNVGAYGVEVKDVVEWVEVYDIKKDEFRKLSNEECQFSYRSSIFKKGEGADLIITEVCFKLDKNGEPKTEYKGISEYLDKNGISEPSISDMRNAVIAVRKEKFPSTSECGTAGSFFKNPILSEGEFEKLKEIFPDAPNFLMPNNTIKVPLGWILEKLGWKNVKKGNVGTFKNQSLVLIAYENATANEITSFVAEIKADVKEKTGIDISNEVTFV